ncbi:hypothetical protein ACFVWT_04270 [Arthrobacter sp. NPDC058288]|uniref:hypothetical protein n=1 Tax=Arthrobacter sp. NPDC058288 TaxID=3346424 RepID=UPI0036E27485
MADGHLALTFALLLGRVPLADDPVDPNLPVPLPLLLSAVGLAGAVLTALIAAWAKRWRTPADAREDRKLNLEADERLLARFEKMLQERDSSIDELRQELKEVRALAESAVTDNRALVDWIYAAVRVVRDLGGIALLPAPPKGVTIADHPAHYAGAKT